MTVEIHNEPSAIIGSDLFKELFNLSQLPDEIEHMLQNIDTSIRKPSTEEVKEYLAEYLKILKGNWIERDSQQNKDAWEKGWSENLNLIRENGVSDELFKPKYFRGSKFLRLQKDIVVSKNEQIEHDLLTVARHYLFNKYLSNFDSIYELGCGSCQNIWMLSKLFPKKYIHGFDWVAPPLEIIQEIKKCNNNVNGSLLDFLNPPPSLNLKPNSAIVSIHALEQIGNNHSKLIESIIKAKPGIVVNYEPTYEFYEDDNIYDYLAKWYSEKRNYLNGYLTRLQQLEKEKVIKILDAFRPGLGGVYHEASVIVWKPL